MAAPMKRKCDNIENVESSKRIALTDISDEKLEKFIEWCSKNNFHISHKVIVSREGSCAKYGMVAVEDIVEGYCLFQVPRSCILEPATCEIADLIEQEKMKLVAANHWVPLLMSLLHEQKNPESKWKPYLDLFPDFNSLDLPLFWESAQISTLLKGTGVDRSVERDLKFIQKDYEQQVVPFFKCHKEKLRGDMQNLDFFQKMVAFVMAYSFTEPEEKESENAENSEDSDDEEGSSKLKVAPPMMVPLADALNHSANNNAKLTFGKEALKMVTTRAIKKGEEIFNTYGQVSNLHLMHMYGFALSCSDNPDDVVEIPAVTLFDAAKCHGQTVKTDAWELNFIHEKWKYLLNMDIITEDEVLVLGKDGFVNEELAVLLLKVMCMSQKELEEYKAKEGWSDAESDNSQSEASILDFAKVHQIDPNWKDLLSKMAHMQLSNYTTTLQEDKDRLKVASSLSSRERYALYIAHGQKMLLQKLLDLIS